MGQQRPCHSPLQIRWFCTLSLDYSQNFRRYILQRLAVELNRAKSGFFSVKKVRFFRRFPLLLVGFGFSSGNRSNQTLSQSGR
jgi:hypothetical protein